MRTHRLSAVINGRAAAVAELRDSLETDGFAVFDRCGIPSVLFDSLEHELGRFFNLDLATKQQYERADIGRQRGYTSPRTEHARDQPPEAADLKEFWQDGPPNSENLGLLPNLVTGYSVFDQTRGAFHDALRGQVDVILRVIAPILDVNPDWLVNYAAGGDDIVRYLRYFSLAGVDFPQGTVRSAPHTDINLITLLLTRGKGLTVENTRGERVEVDIGPRQLVVQMGDMIDVLSGGRLPATKHWVENPDDLNTERSSIALFNHPAPLRWVDVLPHLKPSDGPLANWDARTERSFTFERLIEIGILEAPNPFAHERASRGYTVPTNWADGNQP